MLELNRGGIYTPKCHAKDSTRKSDTAIFNCAFGSLSCFGESEVAGEDWTPFVEQIVGA